MLEYDDLEIRFFCLEGDAEDSYYVVYVHNDYAVVSIDGHPTMDRESFMAHIEMPGRRCLQFARSEQSTNMYIHLGGDNYKLVPYEHAQAMRDEMGSEYAMICIGASQVIAPLWPHSWIADVADQAAKAGVTMATGVNIPGVGLTLDPSDD